VGGGLGDPREARKPFCGAGVGRGCNPTSKPPKRHTRRVPRGKRAEGTFQAAVLRVGAYENQKNKKKKQGKCKGGNSAGAWGEKTKKPEQGHRGSQGKIKAGPGGRGSMYGPKKTVSTSFPIYSLNK